MRSPANFFKKPFLLVVLSLGSLVPLGAEAKYQCLHVFDAAVKLSPIMQRASYADQHALFEAFARIGQAVRSQGLGPSATKHVLNDSLIVIEKIVGEPGERNIHVQVYVSPEATIEKLRKVSHSLADSSLAEKIVERARPKLNRYEDIHPALPGWEIFTRSSDKEKLGLLDAVLSFQSRLVERGQGELVRGYNLNQVFGMRTRNEGPGPGLSYDIFLRANANRAQIRESLADLKEVGLPLTHPLFKRFPYLN